MKPQEIQFSQLQIPTMGANVAGTAAPFQQMGTLLNDLSGYQAYSQPNYAPAYTPVQKEQPKGNFFTNNLATGLSIGGSLLGTLGGPLGTIAGGAIGGGLGKALENVLEEGKIDAGDVAKEAALSGAFGLVGAGAGKVAGKAGQALFGTKFPTVVKKGAEEVGKKALQTASKKVAGTTAETAVKPSAAGRYGARFLQGAFNNTIDEPTARDLYIRYGIKKPAEAIAIKDVVTGSAETAGQKALINKAVENAVATSGLTFDPTDLASPLLKTGLPQRSGTIAEAIIAQQPAGAISEATEKKLYGEFSKAVKDLLGARVGTQNPSAIEGLKASRVFADKARVAKSLMGRNPEAGTVARIYDDFAQELADRALSPMGQDILLDQATKKQLANAIAAEVGAVNKKAVPGLMDDIANATSLRDFRAIQSKWVNAGRAAEDIATQQAQKAGITASGIGEAFSTPFKSTGRATGSFIGRRLDRNMPGLLQGASTAAQRTGMTNPALQTQIGALTGPILPNVIANYESPVYAQGGLGMESGMGAGIGAGGAALGGAASAMPQQGMGAGAQGQPALSELQRAYMGLALFNPTLMGALTMTPEQRAQSASAVEAINSVDTLATALARAGGGQGRIGGTISKIKSFGGGSERTYTQQKRNAAMKIAQALGQDVNMVEQNMPDLTDTAEEAAGKVAALKKALQTTLQASQQTGLSGLGFSGQTGTPSLLSNLMR